MKDPSAVPLAPMIPATLHFDCKSYFMICCNSEQVAGLPVLEVRTLLLANYWGLHVLNAVRIGIFIKPSSLLLEAFRPER